MTIENDTTGQITDSAGTAAAAVPTDENPLQIRSRMSTEGELQVNQNLALLAEQTNLANADFYALMLPGETMQDAKNRIESTDIPGSYAHKVLQKAIAAQTTYSAELAGKEALADNFDAVEGARESEEMVRAYTTAVEGEVTKVSRRFRTSRETALTMVQADLDARGLATVLPIFSKILTRYNAAKAAQPTAVELARAALARAEADAAGSQ